MCGRIRPGGHGLSNDVRGDFYCVGVLRRYRYRAYPTAGQVTALAQVFGCVRVVFNDVVAAREGARRDGEPFPTAGELSRRLVTEAKRTPERAWLSEVSSVPLQQAVRDAERAYRNFFDFLKGKRKGQRVGPPRFKSKRGRQSARFTRNAGFTVTETTHGVGHVRLPKVGRVRFALSRPLPVDPSSVTVLRESDGRHYVSFVVDEPVPGRTDLPQRVAGIDVGLADLATIVYSDGTREKVSNPRWLRVKQRRLARAQRALSRKQKGSANRARARHRVAALHRKVRQTRLDHHHKLAHRLVRENQAVALEGLSVAGLARTRMSKSVHDAGWSILTRLLREKAVTHNTDIRAIGQWEPTTQTCSVCGSPGGRKPLHVRAWTCTSCGTTVDRDYNAAVNIMLAAGLVESLNACGPDIRPRLARAVRDEAGTHRTDHDTEAAWESSPARARRKSIDRGPGTTQCYGIPGFEMKKEILDRRLDVMRAEGNRSAPGWRSTRTSPGDGSSAATALWWSPSPPPVLGTWASPAGTSTARTSRWSAWCG